MGDNEQNGFFLMTSTHIFKVNLDCVYAFWIILMCFQLMSSICMIYYIYIIKWFQIYAHDAYLFLRCRRSFDFIGSSHQFLRRCVELRGAPTYLAVAWNEHGPTGWPFGSVRSQGIQGKMRDSNLTRVHVFFPKMPSDWGGFASLFLEKSLLAFASLHPNWCNSVNSLPHKTEESVETTSSFCTEDAEPPGWDWTSICKFWQSEAPSSSEQGWVDARENECLVRACNPVSKRRKLKFYLTPHFQQEIYTW